MIRESLLKKNEHPDQSKGWKRYLYVALFATVLTSTCYVFSGKDQTTDQVYGTETALVDDDDVVKINAIDELKKIDSDISIDDAKERNEASSFIKE
jgi:hypothetical protein